MPQTQLQLLYDAFDGIRHENGQDYWLARELFERLGYTTWDSFQPAIERAKESCRTQKIPLENHFQDLTKMVTIGSGATRETKDIRLSRYACYMITLNGDPKKPKIAFAQAYFATQTRKMEVLEQRMEEIQRITARNKLKATEKEFASLLWEKGIDGMGIGEIRNAGDKALFGGLDTKDMKKRLGVRDNVPIADVLPSVTIKAKDLATEMTTVNTKKSNWSHRQVIKNEHVKNNTGVRRVLEDAGIRPEELPAQEDVKKITSRHEKEKQLMESRHEKEMQSAKKRNDLLH